jgi:hypothetical protein
MHYPSPRDPIAEQCPLDQPKRDSLIDAFWCCCAFVDDLPTLIEKCKKQSVYKKSHDGNIYKNCCDFYLTGSKNNNPRDRASIRFIYLSLGIIIVKHILRILCHTWKKVNMQERYIDLGRVVLRICNQAASVSMLSSGRSSRKLAESEVSAMTSYLLTRADP